MSTPTVVRIRLRFNDVETFVEKFAPNVTRGGLFLATRNVRPVGDVISFELLLADGSLALGGEGKITWTKEPDPAQPNKPFGMGVQFLSLRPESKSVLLRLLKAKEAQKDAQKDASKDGRPAPGRLSGAHATVEASGPLKGPSTSGAPSGPIPGTSEGTFVGLSGPASRLGGLAGGRAEKVDPHVDLASEMGFDELVLREVASRLRMIPRMGVPVVDASDVLDELLKPSPEEPATLEKALADLPRLLSGAARRRVTGAFRTVVEVENGRSTAERVVVAAPEDTATS